MNRLSNTATPTSSRPTNIPGGSDGGATTSKMKRIFNPLSWKSRHHDEDILAAIKRFDYVHPRKGEPSLAAGVVPTNKPGETVRVYVAEKLFYSQVKGKTFRAHSSENVTDEPFDIIGTTAHLHEKLILKDGDGNPMAVVVRKIVHYNRRYIIYGLHSISPNQHPADLQYKGHHLYQWAKVDETIKGRVSIDTFSGTDHFHTDVYSVEKVKTGFLEGKMVLLKKMGKPAALIQQGAFPKKVSGPAWDGTVAPGIDPSFVICLIAILDETNNI